MNPNFIAFAVQDFPSKRIVCRQVFDLTKLNKTFDKNKKDFEVCEIAKKISGLAKHFKVEIVGVEKLTMKSKNHNKGRRLNRLINNSWNRRRFSNNLIKRLNILGIKNQEIAAQYSSTVGCLNFPEETDSVAAALEIGRRTWIFKKRFLDKDINFSNTDIIFPAMEWRGLKERWNSILGPYNPKNAGYKGIHEYLKQKKKLTELRFLFKDYPFTDKNWSSFSMKSTNSLVKIYQTEYSI